MHVFCDFDDAVTVVNSTDVVLQAFANPLWETIEAEWKAGLIGSGECMRRQVALIDATPQMMDAVLDRVELHPSFKTFADFCLDAGIPMTVVSNGVDYFIERILDRYGLCLPVIANRLQIDFSGFSLEPPLADPRSMKASNDPGSVFIGSKPASLQMIARPGLVFAIGELVLYCTLCKIPFLPCESFDDVTDALRSMTRADWCAVA